MSVRELFATPKHVARHIGNGSPPGLGSSICNLRE
jgi:hypothetical protein